MFFGILSSYTVETYFERIYVHTLSHSHTHTHGQMTMQEIQVSKPTVVLWDGKF
jgi:hypothetical protein